jgi:hypothetical protein
MFKVFAEKEIFENIVLFSDVNPNWNNICCNHADVCLNITDADLSAELIPGSVIFEYINANGGKMPIALAGFFTSIQDEPNIIAEEPRSAFILNISKEKAVEYQSNFGVLVQSSDNLDDNVLRHNFFKELPKGTIIENISKKGWYNLFHFELPPTNSIVITDDYLLRNEENQILVGFPNLKDIFDALLPVNLEVPFHVLILTNDSDKSQKQCEALAGRLKAMIVSLRNYPIQFEIVFTSALHKRKLFMNYISITCDKGFAMFTIKDMKTVRSDNDFRSEMLFTRLNVNEGDTVLISDNLLLKEIQKRCDNVKSFIGANGQTTNYRIMGDCLHDKTIVNRLIQEI